MAAPPPLRCRECEQYAGDLHRKSNVDFNTQASWCNKIIFSNAWLIGAQIRTHVRLQHAGECTSQASAHC